MRRFVLSLSLAVVACLPVVAKAQQANQAQQAKPSRPNILFIYADDQSYKTISCYGSSPQWVKTPNIDRLAARGVRFERSYLGAWCMPSRASLLTGRLQHGVMSMTMEGAYPGSKYDPAQCPMVPAEFRKAGYHTAQIGKWHTGTDTGYRRDWDYQIVWNRPAHPENAGNYYVDQALTFNGVDKKVGGYSTDNYTKWAEEYIKGENRDPNKPWYLWLCYGAIHGPTTPAARHKGSLKGNEATPPADIVGPWKDKPKYLENTAAWTMGPDGKPAMKAKGKRADNFDTLKPGKSYDSWVQQVNECNRAVDEGVGRVLKALEESGQLENTLVVYSADQGYALGEHGLNQKVAPYDASLASAMIISRPGSIPEGAVCRHPINSPDLVDLFCREAGVVVPWKMHGRDIRPLLANPTTKEWVSPMILTHTARSYGAETDAIPDAKDAKLTAASAVPWYVLLRQGKYKYIRTFVKGETEELYDLEADPEELKNLANESVQTDWLATLRKSAIVELKRTDAKFAEALPKTKAEMKASGERGVGSGEQQTPKKKSASTSVPQRLRSLTLPARSQESSPSPLRTPHSPLKFASFRQAAPAARTLDIYWIDVEGGAATLIVTPAGESVLIDSGNPGRRDADRIFAVATKEAGLKKIDHLITTHYHRDHFGGAAQLAGSLPIGTVWDNATWPEQREMPDAEYTQFKAAARKQISPGDAIPLAVSTVAGAPLLELKCLGARQKFVDVSGSTNECCAANNVAPVDNTDNANSVVTKLTFGEFDFLDTGDLTRNREFDLVCPVNRVGIVDVFQVSHHGLDVSNNPVLIKSVEPRVAIVNNGVTKGNGPLMFATLQETKSIEQVYQVHKTLRTDGTSHNVPDEFIANKEKECTAAHHLKLSVAADGRSYTVFVPSTGHQKTYPCK
jgi:arylsulfatase A-like enzyme/beta-lactamase superfamily II metal-dependent hydrolase